MVETAVRGENAGLGIRHPAFGTGTDIVTLTHHFEPENNMRLARLCGPLDAHLRRIEAALGVSIARRGAVFTVRGPAAEAARGLALLRTLYAGADRPIYEQALELAIAETLAQAAHDEAEASPPQAVDPAPTPAPVPAPGLSEAGDDVPAQNVADAQPASADSGASAPEPSALQADPTESRPSQDTPASTVRPVPVAEAIRSEPADPSAPTPPAPAPRVPQSPSQEPPRSPPAGDTPKPPAPPLESPVLHTRRSELKGRTPNQVRYLRQILGNDVTFGIGPAGTGKTFLAVACAVDALERHAVQRLVLTRPAVEAGERLGFLPGDLAQKVDPYLRPLYDALYDLMGMERVNKAFERGQIEIAPLAFMRGRTLNHAFVILDEAQNTTCEQMKMFLTRLGFGSRCVVTGDVSQIDLPSGVRSGLVDAEQVLAGVEGLGFTRFTPADVVRHPLVARIVEAYERQTPDPRGR